MGIVETLLSGQLLFAALVTGSIYALIALGLNLVYGTLRMLNVAHGDVVMLGAYAAYWAFTGSGISPLLAAPVVAGLGAVAGLLVYRGAVRRMLGSGMPASSCLEGNSLLLFFGLSIILQNAAALFLGRSLAGLTMRAVIERREAAYIVGVDVERVQAASFAIGFASAALAGVLLSMLEQFSPFSGFPYTIAAFIVIILGGLGNVAAGLGAAMLLGALETYGVALTSANLRSVLLYGVFVGALLLFPRGLFARRANRA